MSSSAPPPQSVLPPSSTVTTSSASSSSPAPGAAAAPVPAAGSIGAFSAHAFASCVVVPPSSFAFASPSAPLNPFASFSSSLSAALPASAAVAASADPPLFSCGSFGAGSSSSALSAHRSPHRHAATSARLKPKHKAAMAFGTDAGQQEQNIQFKTVEGAAMEAAAVPVAAESAVSAQAAAAAPSAEGVAASSSSAVAPAAASMAARTKVKVNVRRSAGVSSAAGASSSSSVSSAVPHVMYTPLTLAHTQAWIEERRLWDEQDIELDDGSKPVKTADAILSALLAQNIASVLGDLILEFVEPPYMSLQADALWFGTARFMSKAIGGVQLLPAVPSTAVLVGCALEVVNSTPVTVQLRLEEKAATKETLDEASIKASLYLQQAQSEQERLASEMHRATCSGCGTNPILHACVICSVCPKLLLCDSCHRAMMKGGASMEWVQLVIPTHEASHAVTRRIPDITRTKEELRMLRSLAEEDGGEVSPSKVQPPKSIFVELFPRWDMPQRGQFAMSLDGWTSLSVFDLEAAPTIRTAPAPRVGPFPSTPVSATQADVFDSPPPPMPSDVLSACPDELFRIFKAKYERMQSAWREGDPELASINDAALRHAAHSMWTSPQCAGVIRQAALFWRWPRNTRTVAQRHARLELDWTIERDARLAREMDAQARA